MDIVRGYNLISNLICRYDALPRLHNPPKTHLGTSITSITPNLIKRYMERPIEEATFVYNSPVDINFGKRNQFPISLFYLNKQFHFYVSDSTITPKQLLLKSDSLIPLVTQNIREIVDFKRDSWVFDTNDQFYVIGNYVPSNKRGPYNVSALNLSNFYTMDQYQNFRPYYFNMVLNYQYLIFDKFDSSRRRAILYIPEFGVVISGFQKKKSGIIYPIQETREENPTDKPKSFNWTIPMLLLSALLAAFVLSLIVKRSDDSKSSNR